MTGCFTIKLRTTYIHTYKQLGTVNEEKLSIREADTRFGNSNDRLTSLEKRIDDIKWYIGVIITFLTVFFAVISYVFSENANSEKNGLIEFKKEMREDLLKSAPPPEIQLYRDIDVPLEDGNIPAQIFVDSNKNVVLRFNIIAKNSGGSDANNILFKIYSSDPIKFVYLDGLSHKPVLKYSSDERSFKYETFMPINTGAVLPANITNGFDLDFNVLSSPKPGIYPMLLKVTYGVNQLKRQKFNLIIKN
jgi:hypothetical protein